MSEAGARALPRPLAGKRVIDLTQFIAGPSAAMYLADFGAEVIKVEPVHGDGSRTLPGNAFGSYYTRTFNCGKESRVLNLRDPVQRQRLDDWLEEADAFVCNLAPGSLKALGLDGPALRVRFPRLVIALISGYGQDDPRPCMDTVAQCGSGFALLNADEDGSPRLSTGWPVDIACGLVAGMSCAMGMLDPRGKGCVIDISMMEVAASTLLGPAALAISEGDALGRPMGNRDRASAPSNIYRCNDGHVYVLGGLDAYWSRLKPLVGCRDDAPIAERIARAPEFDAVLERWTLQRSRDEVLAEMARLQVPAGAVRSPDDALLRVRALRPDAVTRGLASGEHLPTFPALLDGQRPSRTATPKAGGARRAA